MENCKHEFVGKADGVHCKKCGLHLTAQQYHDSLNPTEKKVSEEKPKRTRSTRKKKEEPASE